MADPNGLYSYKGEEPALITEITLSSGLKRTNPETFTDEELADAGYTGPFTKPNFNPETETQHWDAEIGDWVTESIPNEELWIGIRSERDRRLAECDWTMAADAPQNLNFHEWEMYRQRLRDLPSFYENPKDVIWPISPEGRADDDFDQPRLHEDRLLWRVRDLEEMVKRIATEVFPISVGIASTEV